MPRLRRALGELESLLRAQGAEIADEMLPPIGVESLPSTGAHEALPLPVEVREWFSWHNGVSSRKSSICLPNGYTPLEWRFVIEYSSMITGPWTPETAWNPWPSCITLAKSGTSYLVVDCAVPEGCATPVRMFDTHESALWPTVLAPSLTAAVELWNTCLREGYWRWDSVAGEWAAPQVAEHLQVYGLTFI